MIINGQYGLRHWVLQERRKDARMLMMYKVMNQICGTCIQLYHKHFSNQTADHPCKDMHIQVLLFPRNIQAMKLSDTLDSFEIDKPKVLSVEHWSAMTQLCVRNVCWRLSKVYYKYVGGSTFVLGWPSIRKADIILKLTYVYFYSNACTYTQCKHVLSRLFWGLHIKQE